MASSALENAESWLAVLWWAKLAAAGLVVLGVALEFGGDWISLLDAQRALSSNPDDVRRDILGGAGASGGGLASQAAREAYIRQRAPVYGIDPDVAVRVARSEGLNSLGDSQGGLGDSGTSAGDFQLHVGGGLGDAFRSATGLDPLDSRNWQAADDFALRQAARGGWKPWHGAARVEQLLRRHPEHLRILGAHEKRLAGSKFVSKIFDQLIGLRSRIPRADARHTEQTAGPRLSADGHGQAVND
jgi:hypothetical protein